jgi:hypothetical protein
MAGNGDGGMGGAKKEEGKIFRQKMSEKIGKNLKTKI